MSTGIQWTDETWNPTVGCTKVSQGCKNCYAKTLHDKRHKAHQAGKAVPEQYAEPFETLQLMPERLDYPLHWKKPRRIFVNSVSDLFHEDVPFEFIDQVFAVMALCPQHTFQVLTKRPERMLEYAERIEDNDSPILEAMQNIEMAPWYRLRMRTIDCDYDEDGGLDCVRLLWPLPNVWLGTSVENQEAADQRIPYLLKTPAAIHFLSCEPLLGPVLLHQEWVERESYWHSPSCHNDFCALAGGPDDCAGLIVEHEDVIDWVIVGGESGSKARGFDINWARSLHEQCRYSGIACFIKQLGAEAYDGKAICEECGHARAEHRSDLPAPCHHGRTADVLDSRDPRYGCTCIAFTGSHCVVPLKDSHGGNMDEWPEDLRVREFPSTDREACEVGR